MSSSSSSEQDKEEEEEERRERCRRRCRRRPRGAVPVETVRRLVPRSGEVLETIRGADSETGSDALPETELTLLRYLCLNYLKSVQISASGDGEEEEATEKKKKRMMF